MAHDILAIDAVCNLWTPEVHAIRPNRDAFFGGKMNVGRETLRGITHEEMLRRMDAAGIDPGRRPQTLGFEEFGELAREIRRRIQP